MSGKPAKTKEAEAPALASPTGPDPTSSEALRRIATALKSATARKSSDNEGRAASKTVKAESSRRRGEKSKRDRIEPIDWTALHFSIEMDNRGSTPKYKLTKTVSSRPDRLDWSLEYVKELRLCMAGGNRAELARLLQREAPLHPRLLPALAKVVMESSHVTGRPKALSAQTAHSLRYDLKHHMSVSHGEFGANSIGYFVRDAAEKHNVSESTIRRAISGWRRVKLHR